MFKRLWAGEQPMNPEVVCAEPHQHMTMSAIIDISQKAGLKPVNLKRSCDQQLPGQRTSTLTLRVFAS